MERPLIVIVDDDPQIRALNADVLEHFGFAVLLCDGGESFLACQPPRPPACVLLDLAMPGVDGLAVMRALRRRGDAPPVVVLTGAGCIASAVEAMKLGAHDYVEKPFAPACLIQTIRDAIDARTGLAPHDAQRAQAAAALARLSRRQMDVLRGILRGRMSKVIAYELGLSIRTVEAYRSHAFQNLGARNTADAIRLARLAGYFEDGAEGRAKSAQHEAAPAPRRRLQHSAV